MRHNFGLERSPTLRSISSFVFCFASLCVTPRTARVRTSRQTCGEACKLETNVESTNTAPTDGQAAPALPTRCCTWVSFFVTLHSLVTDPLTLVFSPHPKPNAHATTNSLSPRFLPVFALSSLYFPHRPPASCSRLSLCVSFASVS